MRQCKLTIYAPPFMMETRIGVSKGVRENGEREKILDTTLKVKEVIGYELNELVIERYST